MGKYMNHVANKEQYSIFQPIAEAVSCTMNLPVGIWIFDEQSQVLRIAAAVGLPPSYVREAFLSLSEPSVTGESFTSGKVVIVHNVLSDPRWKYRNAAKDAGWRSALCVPILAHGTTIGVIDIYTLVERDFSDLEKRLLEDYAVQVGLALEADRRLKTLRRLLDIGDKFERLITEQPTVVLQEIVKGACEVTGADCAVIYPYDAAREEFYDIESVAHHGLCHPLDLKDKPRGTGMGGYVVRTGEVVVSNLTCEDRTLFRSAFLDREDIKAFMGIALVIGERVLGILYVDFRTPHEFSEEDKDTIRLFAHEAAVAIDNSRLYQQASTRAEALKRLHELGPALVSIPGAPVSLDTILAEIVHNAQHVLGADLVDLYQYIQSRDEYVFPPIQVGRRYDPQIWKNRVYADDVICTTAKSRQPLYVAEAQQEPTLTQPFTVVRPDAPTNRFVIRENIKSMAAVPLIVRNEVVGVLFVNYRSPQTFPQQQKELIELFASQAAIAIRNARLYEEARSEAIAAKQLATLGTAMSALQHRINNTFNIIVPNVMRLRRRIDTTDNTIVEILDIIERNARYASDIIARIQEPLREVENQDVNINAVLNDVVGKVREQWQADLSNPMVTVDLELDDSIPHIYAPIGQIAEVFRNLIDNAYHAMKAGGKLSITSSLTDGTICVRVQDTGPGIPPQVQQRLFISPVPSKDPGGGAGLGLWLSHLMLQSIGGAIMVEKSDSTGTAMLVQIPASRLGKS